MYVRMLVLLVISLYTSRIVINALGIENYGIYNVVGGVIVLFSFINGAMSTGTQRHLSYELAKEDGNVPKIFSACLYIHASIAFFIFILAETIGLWFLNVKMQFPSDRIFAANVVYQISIISAMIGIVRVPYNAAVIAWERMSYYAYISIFEGGMKLLIAFLITTTTYDRLIVYSILHMGVILIVFTALIMYCHYFQNRLKLEKVRDMQLYKYLLSFTGWTLFGSAAVVGETQGLNVFINMFFGVTINAAVGVSNQIKGILQQFVSGFQMAFNPQLVKLEAEADREHQFDLIYKSSKFSFYILLITAIPVTANLSFLLHIWLGVIPPYTEPITNLIIIVALFECLSYPLYTTIFAIGDIRFYQIYIALLRSVSIILGYIICQYGAKPYYVYIVPVIISVLLLLYRIYFVKDKIGLTFKAYGKNVFLPIFKVLIFGVVPIILYKENPLCRLNFILWLVESSVFIIYITIIIYYLGIETQERKTIYNMIMNRLKKNIFKNDKRTI